MQLCHLMMSLNETVSMATFKLCYTALWLSDMNLILKQACKSLAKFTLTNSFAQLSNNEANKINLTLARLRL
jgi:hypothetical protein